MARTKRSAQPQPDPEPESENPKSEEEEEEKGESEEGSKSEGSGSPKPKKQKGLTLEGINSPFPSPFEHGQHSPNPYIKFEIDLQAMMASIRTKPEWRTKVFDEEIVAKWRKEAAEMLPPERTDDSMDEDSDGDEEKPPQPNAGGPGFLDWSVAYLRAETKEHEGKMSDKAEHMGFGVYFSRSAIGEDLRGELLKNAAPLEEGEKDWHPNSNQQVLDLVHPSLFPVIFGQTLVLREGKEPASLADWRSVVGGGEVAHRPARNALDLDMIFKPHTGDTDAETESSMHSDSERAYGDEEWIPGMGIVWSNKYQWLPSEFEVDNDGKVKIASYINNLHPEDHAPLYKTLESVFESMLPMFEYTLGHTQKGPSQFVTAGLDTEEISFVSSEQFKVPTYDPAKTPVETIEPYNLKGRTLKVIVKLANIVLTPESPKYDGGSWHVEGMRNESIVASGIYYYETENISQSTLAFRQGVRQPVAPAQCEGLAYGLGFDDPLSQDLVSITTDQGKAICFPNVYQHQVQPFELEDKSKGGHRKILVFFLVDPFEGGAVLSSKRVPPQQKSWYRKHMVDQAALPIPNELLNLVVDASDQVLDLDQAKKHREELMQERSKFVVKQNERVFERGCGLCEH